MLAAGARHERDILLRSWTFVFDNHDDDDDAEWVLFSLIDPEVLNLQLDIKTKFLSSMGVSS